MVAKLCSRSHGQPRCGSRSRAIRVSSSPSECCGSAMSGRGALQRQRPDAQSIERQQHPGSRTPDRASLEWNVAEIHLPLAADQAAALPAKVARIEQVVERYLEGPPYLLRIERECEARLHHAHHRCDAKARDDDVIGKVARD